jgi:hypothetical protein
VTRERKNRLQNFPFEKIDKQALSLLEDLSIAYDGNDIEDINFLISNRLLEDIFGPAIKMLLYKSMLLGRSQNQFGSQSKEHSAVFKELTENIPMEVSMGMMFFDYLMKNSSVIISANS